MTKSPDLKQLSYKNGCRLTRRWDWELNIISRFHLMSEPVKTTLKTLPPTGGFIR